MPSLDFESEKTAFRAYYGDNYELLRDCEEFVRSLITALLSGVSGLEKPSVISRLKDREESIRKFSRKYLAGLESQRMPYRIRDYIADLIGIRVVCLYEEDIAVIVDRLRANFRILDESDKIKKMETTEDTFGYKGFHMDLTMNEAREALPEYARFSDLRYEVQVRTIIQDAWSVLDHKIKYKKAIPAYLKRRINGLAALFEIADREFLRVRDETADLQSKTDAKVQAETQAAGTGASDAGEGLTPLDVFSFLAVAKKHFDGYNFFPRAAEGFVQEILNHSPGLTTLSLDAVLTERLPAIQRYRDESLFPLNPYTQMRHALYLDDRTRYRAMLFDRQREGFEDWCNGLGDESPVA